MCVLLSNSVIFSLIYRLRYLSYPTQIWSGKFVTVQSKQLPMCSSTSWFQAGSMVP